MDPIPRSTAASHVHKSVNPLGMTLSSIVISGLVGLSFQKRHEMLGTEVGERMQWDKVECSGSRGRREF